MGLLDNIADPLELHLFASNWNCDQGVDPLLSIVRHECCDAGTALWLYWDNDPYFYLSDPILTQEGDGETKQMVQLLRGVEERFLSDNFATRRIPFDPSSWIEDEHGAGRAFPEAMYRSIPTL